MVTLEAPKAPCLDVYRHYTGCVGQADCPLERCIFGMSKRRLQCPYCGQSFVPRDARQKYCSVECRKRGNSLQYYHEHCKKELPPRACTVCGTEFVPRHPKYVTCSDACSRKHAYRRQRARKLARAAGE